MSSLKPTYPEPEPRLCPELKHWRFLRFLLEIMTTWSGCVGVYVSLIGQWCCYSALHSLPAPPPPSTYWLSCRRIFTKTSTVESVSLRVTWVLRRTEPKRHGPDGVTTDSMAFLKLDTVIGPEE